MGIKYLTRLIRDNSPESITHIQLHKLSGKRVGIDASLFIYQSLMNIRSGGELLTNDSDKVTSHIAGIFYKTAKYLSLNITPIYFFDGKPPIEKKAVIKSRKEKASIATENMKKCENKEEKEKLSKMSIRLTKEYIEDIKELLTKMGVTYIHIDGEAEAIASEMCRIGFIDYVVTEDMDTLTFGCPNMVRNCVDKSLKKQDTISVFNLDRLLIDLEFTYDQFVELCIMCGCDYCSNIPRIGQVKSLQFIKKYGSIESFLESNEKFKIPEGYVEKYQCAKKLFKMYHGKLNPSEMPFVKSDIDIGSLMKYLINDCQLNEEKILNTIKKIQEKYNSD